MAPRVLVTLLLACAVLGTLALAQTPPKFEVATIKPADPNANGQFIRLPSPGRISVTNMTLLQLIRFAYSEGLGTNLEITGGPNWLDKDRYDLDAKAEGTATPAELRLMMRTLLADRFGLKLHPDTKEVNVYAMVLARSDGKLGPKVQPWDGKCNGREPPPGPSNPKMPHCGAFFRPPGMVLEGVTMAVVADMLSTPIANLGRVVVDRTGLTGEFTMQLEFQFRPPGPGGAQAPPDDTFAPSLFTALQEQLGLKLQSARGNTDLLVVDQAARPTEN